MCEYCNFGTNDEYLPDKSLDVKILVDGTKQDFEVHIEEDYEYDHFIMIDGTYTDIQIPVEYCPKCGRKL